MWPLFFVAYVYYVGGRFARGLYSLECILRGNVCGRYEQRRIVLQEAGSGEWGVVLMVCTVARTVLTVVDLVIFLISNYRVVFNSHGGKRDFGALRKGTRIFTLLGQITSMVRTVALPV